MKRFSAKLPDKLHKEIRDEAKLCEVTMNSVLVERLRRRSNVFEAINYTSSELYSAMKRFEALAGKLERDVTQAINGMRYISKSQARIEALLEKRAQSWWDRW